MDSNSSEATLGNGDEMPRANDSILEPIAIVGIAFKFPQGAESENSLWDKLMKQECTSTEWPKDRLNINGFWNPDPKKMNTIRPRNAHFLHGDIRNFDAQFFGLPPAEAAGLDPQQRGLLETTLHAFENAGIRTRDLAGTDTSVHVGSFCTDYLTFVLRDEQRIPTYNATGCSQTLLSNRISWAFDLRGASLTLDTACSSGLVALDLACRELWSGRSSTAVCAASNVMLSPEMNMTLSNMNFLSPDGKCYSFDHRASGYARGEGFATLILQPLSQALKENNTIRALIRSTGTNQDGHTAGGITLPNKSSQVQLIHDTYRTGTPVGDPIEARAIGECFGAFRSTEDPLHIGAVKTNLGHLEGASGLAGVIKTVLALEKGIIPPNTNFETLNAAIDDEYFHLAFPQSAVSWPSAGIRRASVNSFGYGGTNAHVVLDDALSYLQQRNMMGCHRVKSPNGASGELMAVPPYREINIDGQQSKRMVAEIHHYSTKVDPKGFEPLQIGEGIEKERKDSFYDLQVIGPRLMLFSAADEMGVSRQATAHHQSLLASSFDGTAFNDPAFLDRYALTLATCRDAHVWKSFCLIDSIQKMGKNEMAISIPTRGCYANPVTGFVFTGQGAQWHLMGRELLACAPFSRSIYSSQTFLSQLGWSYSITDLLTNEKHKTIVSQARFSQILTTVVQIALVDLFQWLKLVPKVVVGHSSGEIAAAYCAGHIDHASALKISFYRGILSSVLEKDTSGRCSMAAVGLSTDRARAEFDEFEHATPLPRNKHMGFTISCINSQESTTISGPDDVLEDFVRYLNDKQIFARKLKVGVGYHSPQMLRIASSYEHSIHGLDSCSPDGERPMMVSSVTAKPVTAHEVCSPAYWVRNMVSTVDFLGAIRFCCQNTQEGSFKNLDMSHRNQVCVQAWIEIGPHAALQGPLKQILKVHRPEDPVCYTSALYRGQSALQSMLNCIGYIHCQNVNLDLARATTLTLADNQISPIPNLLPRYVFNHSTLYWEESPSNIAFRLRPHPKHDLVGVRTDGNSQAEARWKFIIKPNELPWVKDHCIQGSTIYPAAGTLAMVLEAAKQLIVDERVPIAFELTDVEFPAPVRINSDLGVELNLHMSTSLRNGSNKIIDHSFRTILREADGRETEVCSGNVRGDYERAVTEVDAGREYQASRQALQADFCQALQDCNQRMDSNDMYSSMAKLGLEYGPCFQTVSDVAYERCGRAVATILISEPNANDGKSVSSTYVVHPSRLDGLFQMGFSTLKEHSPARGLIPTRIGKLWIPVTGFGEIEADVKAYCKAIDVSERGATFAITVYDAAFTDLVTKIDNLELTAVSNASETRFSLDDAPYHCSYMTWKPDVDLMERGGLARMGKMDLSSTTLRGYLDHLAHKRPQLRYLDIGYEFDTVTTACMAALESHEIGSRFQEYVVLRKDTPCLDRARTCLPYSDRLYFKLIDQDTGHLPKTVERGRYDVIILDTQAVANIQQFISTQLRGLLQEDGKLILLEREDGSNMTDIDDNHWQHLLEQSGYCIDDVIRGTQANREYPRRIFISSIAGEPGAIDYTVPTIILDQTSPRQMGVARELCRLFEVDIETSTQSLTEAAASLENERRHYIFIQDLERPTLKDMEASGFKSIKSILARSKSLIWVKQESEDPDHSINDGLLRVSRHENGNVALVSLALDVRSQRPAEDIARPIQIVHRQLQKNINGVYEPEYAEKNGYLCINRLTRARRLDEHVFSATETPLLRKAIGDQALRLSIRTPGALGTLEWIEDLTLQGPLGAKEIEFEVQAIGINFKDALALLGRVTTQNLGSECAGVVTHVGSSVTHINPGDRIATGLLDTFRTRMRVPETDAYVLPEHISLVAAASIPTAFRTAYYCLVDLARLQKGESILIHRASGATGQAAIQLAQKLDAVIYATVGSESKKKLLIEQYNIPENHILYSRDTSFADGIRRLTEGRGVDVILNSLTGKLLETSWEIIAPWGRFIEIGLSDAFSRQKLPMLQFTQGVTFASFNLSNFSRFRMRAAHDRLTKAYWELLESGDIRPVYPLQVYSVEQAEAAFRLLQSGDSSGKLVLELSKESKVPTMRSSHSTLLFDANATFIIVGGLGGLGRSIAQWMCGKGAKNLILISRSGLSCNQKAQKMVSKLQESGVRVECPQVDIGNFSMLERTIGDLAKCMPPIKGCFQSAMVLRDSTLSRMSVEEWKLATEPKVQGSWNLHQILPSGMDFFVLLSSVVGIGGNGGQSNYAAGCTYEDSLARYRVKIGEKAVAIDLGLVLGEGVVAENDAIMEHLLRRRVTRPNSMGEVLAILDFYCSPDCPMPTPEESQLITGLSLPADIIESGHSVPVELKLPTFSIMHTFGSRSGVVGQETGQTQSFKTVFMNAEDVASGAKVASDMLKDQLGRLLGVDELELGRPLGQYGIDSLIALEIKNWIGKEMGADLAVFEISGEATLLSIGHIVSIKSHMRPHHWTN
ncbi:reducing type I polyketide synthase [Corynespora cassiicola Philippines]|uniref:Reducing type I polyketide synthase n=1 Tax=Corynespora cassiicola Philippines TaxID=1448308 RepID=A0A2T2NMB3_CORCC|nr:reducing type I polyketide synthase [Corynespora cassiicola Philippines]